MEALEKPRLIWFFTICTISYDKDQFEKQTEEHFLNMTPTQY